MIDAMILIVKLGLNIASRNTAYVVVRMRRLLDGQRNKAVTFGLKATFGEDARE